MATARTTTPLTAFDERGITSLAATNAGWLPYLADEGIHYVHYSVNRVKRQFRFDQDIPDKFIAILESTTSVHPFLCLNAFEFWSKHFTAVTIPSSQKQGLYTTQMHRYLQAVMISFGQELLSGHGFYLIPLKGLYAVISANPRLLLPTKSMVAYARKQSRSTIFEWQEKEKGWYLYTSEFPLGLEKRVNVVNLPTPTKNCSVSQTTKPKSIKRGGDSSNTCSDLVPYKGAFPLSTTQFLRALLLPLLELFPARILMQAILSLLL